MTSDSSETPEILAEKSEARAAFLLNLRSSGVRDLNLLRAMESFSRDMFVAAEYCQFAYRNLALPLKCGQVLPEPILIARMIEALALEPHHLVLEIGTGSGFATSILAQLAEKIISFERFKTLALQAKARLALVGLKNTQIIHGDGLAIPSEMGKFDRLIVHGLLDECPPCLFEHMQEKGILILALKDNQSATGQSIFCFTRDSKRAIYASRFQKMLPGTSAV
jgi:protein-L-isoaspartate(D-aspartate) O-methyltransferase